jgi:hypothetical protein
MKAKLVVSAVCAALLLVYCVTPAASADWQFGIGFQGGIARLEGDDPNSTISPMVSGHLIAAPVPFFAFKGELGYSSLNTKNHPTNLKTMIVPFELSGVFNFLPFNKVNPYIFVGGGGFRWEAKDNTGILEKNWDSFVKTGGGLEFRVSRNVGINVAGSFRLSFTDALDQIRQGDEDDQVLDVHAGVTYYFNKGKRDRDRDMIADEIDLMPDIAEDKDGFMDHDGVPEKNPDSATLASYGSSSSSPVVIHQIVDKVEAKKNVRIDASIYSNVPLKAVATLYRPVGSISWNVVHMEENGRNAYRGEIPAYAVTGQGFEYCVVAVDETLNGIGYSGLPSRPIVVETSPSGKTWRILGGVVGAAAIGTATYVVLRKQK